MKISGARRTCAASQLTIAASCESSAAPPWRSSFEIVTSERFSSESPVHRRSPLRGRPPGGPRAAPPYVLGRYGASFANTMFLGARAREGHTFDIDGALKISR